MRSLRTFVAVFVILLAASKATGRQLSQEGPECPETRWNYSACDRGAKINASTCLCFSLSIKIHSKPFPCRLLQPLPSALVRHPQAPLDLFTQSPFQPLDQPLVEGRLMLLLKQ